MPARPGLPLLAGLPTLLAVSLLGAGPATIVALIGGMVRSLFESHLIQCICVGRGRRTININVIAVAAMMANVMKASL